jgi:hypothetical protein
VEIQVLVEPVNNNGYRASALTLSVEAATPQEAIARLQELFAERLAAGVSVTTIQVPGPPWAKYAGTWKADDPVIEEWRAIVEENRRGADQQENPL